MPVRVAERWLMTACVELGCRCASAGVPPAADMSIINDRQLRPPVLVRGLSCARNLDMCAMEA